MNLIVENTIESFINENTNVFTAIDGEIPDAQDAIGAAYRVALGSVFMMSLGGYIFRSNFNPFEQSIDTHSYEWSSFKADKEYIEFKRKNAETKALKLKVIAESESELSIDRNLQLLADKAQPLQVFGGSFNRPLNQGKWAITGLTIVREEFVAYGDPIITNIDLRMKKYHNIGEERKKKIKDYIYDYYS